TSSFLAAFACASLKDKGYWGEEDPFDAPQSFFKNKVNEWRRYMNGRSIKNNTTSSGDGFQFILWVRNGVTRERSRSQTISGVHLEKS
nr:hypothetical protein [Tanacetum cinerariifolium]